MTAHSMVRSKITKPPQSSATNHRQWIAQATAPAMRFWVFASFIAIVALMGGGSRADIQSLVVLRPVAFLMAAYALCLISKEQLRSTGAALWFVTALAILMVAQLLPLPADLWTALPGREPMAALDIEVGLGAIWRPLTLSPSGTLNSLFSLIVPLTVTLLIAIQDKRWRSRLLWALLAVAGTSAILSLLQAIGPTRGPFYFYRITNFGSPVGLFANRNHNAIFLAAIIPLLGFASVQGAVLRQRIGLWLSLAAALFILPLILVIGSRAGAVLAFVAIVSTAGLCALSIWGMRAPRQPQASWMRWAAIGFGFVAIGMVSAVTLALSRSRATQRLFSEPLEADFRVQVFGYLRNLAETYFPFGSGFGTFEHVYYAIEPAVLLRPQYLNHAHNDVLQVLIEGGLPAGAIITAGAIWLGSSVIKLIRHSSFNPETPGARSRSLAGFAILSLLILLAGSVADYPLRTPLIMAFMAVLASFISAGISAGISYITSRSASALAGPTP